MNIKKIISLLLLHVVLIVNFSCQESKKEKTDDSNKEYLQGLTKANEKDLGEQEIMFDGKTFPVYNMTGARIEEAKMIEMMMSGNYTPDFYIDKNKTIKAAVLRDATEEEKLMMQGMETEMTDGSILIGKDAIPFSAKDINGNEYSLNRLKENIIVMNFWFVECKPCVMEMPELNELVKNYKNKDVVFLGFATNDKQKLDSFLKKKNFSYNIIPNSKKIAAAYKVSGYPTHIIIDKNSKIVYSTSGLGPTTIDDIEKTIEHLIKK